MADPNGQQAPQDSYGIAPTTPQQAGDPYAQQYAQTPYEQPQYSQSPYEQPQYGQAPYGQAPYGQPPAQPQYAPAYAQPEPRWNGMAIAGFVCSFFVAIVGLALSIVGYTQVKKSGEKGRGLALAGIIISAVEMVASVILAIVLVVAGTAGVAALVQYSNDQQTSSAQATDGQPNEDGLYATVEDYFNSPEQQEAVDELMDTLGSAAEDSTVNVQGNTLTMIYRFEDIDDLDDAGTSMDYIAQGFGEVLPVFAKTIDANLEGGVGTTKIHVQFLGAGGKTLLDETYQADENTPDSFDGISSGTGSEETSYELAS